MLHVEGEAEGGVRLLPDEPFRNFTRASKFCGSANFMQFRDVVRPILKLQTRERVRRGLPLHLLLYFNNKFDGVSAQV